MERLVVGEWSFAYSLENRERGSYFKPTFLTVSETLENGASYRSISDAFAKLWQSEQKAILTALYRQEAPPALGSKAKKVYSDIRALASKLHQGNQNFLSAYSGYVEKKSSASPLPIPSAPPLARRNIEVEFAENVAFLRETLSGLPGLRSDILGGRGKERLATLCILRGLKTGENLPSFFDWNAALPFGKSLREAAMEFSRLSEADFKRLEEAALSPYPSPPYALRSRFEDAAAFGRLLVSNSEFKRAVDALKIDLLAGDF